MRLVSPKSLSVNLVRGVSIEQNPNEASIDLGMRGTLMREMLRVCYLTNYITVL